VSPRFETTRRRGSLDLPELADLVVDGTPGYAWPPDDRRAWEPPQLSLTARTLKSLTAAGGPAQ